MVGLGIVNAGRTARNDDGFPVAQCRQRSLTGRDLGVNSQIAYFTRDQMTILPARIEDGYLWIQDLFLRVLGSDGLLLAVHTLHHLLFRAFKQSLCFG